MITIEIIGGKAVTILIGTNAEHCIDVYGGTWVDSVDADIGIGWTWDGEQFLPPEIEEVTDEITD